ncbi:c-type cytochrome biogenesis protein CcmI [Aestuariicella sp. G3-2]|uniref:c-type cytochrome biogenesis protein CcmI n=1 Tax=Pseudomaricurvus albidus TaxID=2842452 RepID=UPI001C0B01C9|nr:c-type cytochrome biogenesis protein CcmI [Aestuariicella albida]MBU3069980.1 c-type cytochrome biogenesis protein CcmI [Aestuariicella albida]
MGNFWLVVAAMSALSVVFILWPLWRQSKSQQADSLTSTEDRKGVVLDLFNEHLQALESQLASGELDQSQFDQLKKELELSLLEDIAEAENQGQGTSRWGLYLAAALLPLAAAGFYWQHGSIEDVKILDLREAYFQQTDAVSGQQDLDELIASLESRLEKKPDNVGNRYLLARSYMQKNDYVKAVGAYMYIAQHNEEVPPNILGELAQAVFLASGNRVTPEVQSLAEKALAKNPDETTSLGLMGIAEFERQDYGQAIQYWERAVQALGASTPAARSLLAGIERARALSVESGQAPLVLRQPGQSSPADSESSDSQSRSLTVKVSLSDKVTASPGDTVFIYARAWQGARVPLAIQRFTVANLPAEITLDESMAMAPNMTINSVPKLEVVARISKTGEPVPQSGDWQGSYGPVVLAELNGPLTLSVDQQIP